MLSLIEAWWSKTSRHINLGVSCKRAHTLTLYVTCTPAADLKIYDDTWICNVYDAAHAESDLEPWGPSHEHSPCNRKESSPHPMRSILNTTSKLPQKFIKVLAIGWLRRVQSWCTWLGWVWALHLSFTCAQTITCTKSLHLICSALCWDDSNRICSNCSSCVGLAKIWYS